MESNLHKYRTLFKETFLLSAFTFGGGYVIVPLMQKKFVEKLAWIDETEMLNLVAIAQSAPGPIAVNASILIGYQAAGLLGALVAILGTVLPPLIIITLVAHFYDAFASNPVVAAVLKGMQIGVAAVIVSVVWTMAEKILRHKSWLLNFIMVATFVASYVFDWNLVVVIMGSALVGCVYYYHQPSRDKGAAS